MTSSYVVRSLPCLRIPMLLSTQDGTHPVDPEGILLVRRPGENPTLFALEAEAYGAIVRTLAHGQRYGYAWTAEEYELQPWDEFLIEERRFKRRQEKAKPEEQAA